MFKSRRKHGQVNMKILLLSIISLTTMRLFSDENFVSFGNLHKREVVYECELIKKIGLEGGYKRIYFTKPTLNNSGDLSLVESRSMRLLRCDASDNLIELDCHVDGNILLTEISPHGEYIAFQTRHEALSDSIAYSYMLYDLQGRLIWSMDNTSESRIPGISDNGDVFFSMGMNKRNILNKDKTTYEFGDFYKEETLRRLPGGSLGSPSAMSSQGNAAVFASESEDISPADYSSFPLGTRMFFYSEKGELLNTYDLVKEELLLLPFQFSDSGRFFILHYGDYMYLFKDNKLIHEENVGSFMTITFSENESIAFIITHSGCFIFHPETGEMTRTDFKGQKIAIADQGYPIVAGFSVNRIYAANYETGELMLYEELPRYDSCQANLQISGDGKMISLGFNNQFRKYEIGDRK